MLQENKDEKFNSVTPFKTVTPFETLCVVARDVA